MYLSQVPEGSDVVLDCSLQTAATVLKQGYGSVAVKLETGEQTLWSPKTPVRIKAPAAPAAGKATPAAGKATPAAPAAGKATPAAPAAGKATPAAGKDIFGVKVGSAAARVNELLLEIKKDATVDAICSRDSSLIKANVKAHLKRMAKDGLIKDKTVGEGKSAVVYYSLLPKKKVKA